MTESGNRFEDSAHHTGAITVQLTLNGAPATDTNEHRYTVSPSDSETLKHYLLAGQAVTGAAVTALASRWGPGGIIAISGLSAAVQELTFRLATTAIDSQDASGVEWVSRGSQAAIVGGGAALAASLWLGLTGQPNAALSLAPVAVVLAQAGINTHYLMPDDQPRVTLRLTTEGEPPSITVRVQI